jgi:excisionase family DNA binding protein
MPRQDQLLTVPEACAELRIAPVTFYRWRRNGKGPNTILVGTRMVRIRRSELDRYLERDTA